jgi:hypothetical protein
MSAQFIPISQIEANILQTQNVYLNNKIENDFLIDGAASLWNSYYESFKLNEIQNLFKKIKGSNTNLQEAAYQWLDITNTKEKEIDCRVLNELTYIINEKCNAFHIQCQDKINEFRKEKRLILSLDYNKYLFKILDFGFIGKLLNILSLFSVEFISDHLGYFLFAYYIVAILILAISLDYWLFLLTFIAIEIEIFICLMFLFYLSKHTHKIIDKIIKKINTIIKEIDKMNLDLVEKYHIFADNANQIFDIRLKSNEQMIGLYDTLIYRLAGQEEFNRIKQNRIKKKTANNSAVFFEKSI